METIKLNNERGIKMNATKKYLTVAETAKIVRTALKQAFPATKFSVRSKSYSGGASIDISWTDGPTSAQVKKIADKLEGATFDGMTDYKGGKTHLYNGEAVHFGADFIFECREYSDYLIQTAINSLLAEFGDSFIPTIEQYRQGELWRNYVVTNAQNSPFWSWGEQISKRLNEISEYINDPAIPEALMPLGGVIREY